MPAFLSSLPVSLVQPGRACALCLCWECCQLLCAWGGGTSSAAAQGSHSPCMALPWSEVPNTEMRPEDTGVALSGLLCIESQENTKRSLPNPRQSLTRGSLQGVHGPPGSLFCGRGLCLARGGQRAPCPHKAAAAAGPSPGREALTSWTSSHPPQLSWHPRQRRTPLTGQSIPPSLLQIQ